MSKKRINILLAFFLTGFATSGQQVYALSWSKGLNWATRAAGGAVQVGKGMAIGLVLISPFFYSGWKANWILYQNSKFINAAAKGDMATVRSYLNAGYSPITRGIKEYEYIDFYRHWDPSDEWSMDSLMENPKITLSKINAGQGAGPYTPFFEAVKHGHTDIVEQMLKHPCFKDVQVQKHYLNIAYVLALGTCNRKLALSLMAHGADYSLVIENIENQNHNFDKYKIYNQYLGRARAFAKSVEHEHQEIQKKLRRQEVAQLVSQVLINPQINHRDSGNNIANIIAGYEI